MSDAIYADNIFGWRDSLEEIVDSFCAFLRRCKASNIKLNIHDVSIGGEIDYILVYEVSKGAYGPGQRMSRGEPVCARLAM